MSIYLYLSLSIYIYIYIYMYTSPPRPPPGHAGGDVLSRQAREDAPAHLGGGNRIVWCIV